MHCRLARQNRAVPSSGPCSTLQYGLSNGLHPSRPITHAVRTLRPCLHRQICRPLAASPSSSPSPLPPETSFPGTSPTMEASLMRVDELRAERERVAAQLASISSALKAELARERSILAPLQSESELDNFGYIRQFSGEPYDSTKAMGVPGGMAEMGIENFLREGRSLLDSVGVGKFLPQVLASEVGVAPPKDTPEMKERKRILDSLTLSNDAVWDREKKRPPVKSPLVIKIPYYFLCWVLDVIFEDRPIQRFWLLETVARMPYFSYTNMLHLYETLGWWRRSLEARKVHFAEEWNEAHHLLIMESLGGDRKWSDRFIAQHAAVVYYIVLLLMWLISPTLAYNFSELIEAHAVDTYGQFVDENEALLKQLPPPRVARVYYESEDMYLFDLFQSEREPGTRYVNPGTLYDVFRNIRDDEAEHVATMRAMQDQDVLRRAPNIEVGIALLLTLAGTVNVWLPRTGDLEGGAAAEGLGGLVEFVSAVLTDLAALIGFL